MEETKVEQPKKRRGWPKGKPRGPRTTPVVAPTFTSAPEPEAPIHVSLLLKNGATREFGCAEHTVENGFHVFLYPSERDRYRTTRREFAISEIVEIEITAARNQVAEKPHDWVYLGGPTNVGTPPPPATTASSGPKIHSVKRHAESVLGALASSDGPIKMDRMPSMSFGDSAGLPAGVSD
jgi:hypothetical protein